MWFEKLVGFREENPDQVRSNLMIEDDKLISRINGKSYKYGKLEVPTLQELRESLPRPELYNDIISISEIVGDVQEFHKDPINKGALFQAASQFNLLEMLNYRYTPEDGIGIYENDHTQGPACAIACGAGTIFRNYFIKMDNQIGQSALKQIDCMEEIGIALKNQELHLWDMKNGYTLANLQGLKTISEHINKLYSDQYEKLKGKLKIGLQWDTEVTISNSGHLVSQAYCSALPIAYTDIKPEHWESFARLILEALYESTFYAALKNYENTGNRLLFLTLVGGGAFGNMSSWIFDAIEKSVKKFKNTPLDVRIVSYGRSKVEVNDFIWHLN
ncbi:MAG: hypothetical protein IPH57_11560 [Saprospiraceae bacterium]|nr:hypothetical protein [Saprospiraceae bacterium]